MTREPETSSASVGRATDEKSPPKPVNVLVVDDDVDVREVLEEVLTDEGYSVVTARNGAEALECLARLRPGLILLDLNMPIMNGAEFRRRQRDDPSLREVPTVAMTAVDQVYEAVEGLAFKGVLAKPIELERLLETVGRYCKRE